MKSLLFIIMIVLGSVNQVNARWATIEDAPAKVLSDHRTIEVDCKGHMVETIKRQVQILNERGRMSHGTWKIPYTRDVEKVTIIEAKTVTLQGKEEHLKPSMIEDKPVGNESWGFDEKAEITLAYPQAHPGSILHLNYQIVTYNQPFPKYFDQDFNFGENEYLEKSQIILRSHLPFGMWVNDPEKKLLIKKYQQGKIYGLSIQLKKPTYHALINEPTGNRLDERLCTWVRISSYTKPEQVNAAKVAGYEAILAQPLPEGLQSILTEAKCISDEISQINHVTSLLATRVRYMGDWRSNKGRFAPRALSEVHRTGFGDCKDFAANTVVLLRALGHQAWCAVVWRGERYVIPERYWPPSASNHAIVRVVTKGGRHLWIDPTNFVSMAQGIFLDIQDRYALVLNSQGGSYERIPSIDLYKAHRHRTSVAEILSADSLLIRGRIQLKGEGALGLAGAALYCSEKTLKDWVCESLGGGSAKDRQVFWETDLKKREVQDISVRYTYTDHNRLLLTNRGLGISLPVLEWMQAIVDVPKDQVGIFWIPVPLGTNTRVFFLKGREAVGNLSALKVTIQSPWFDMERCVEEKDQGLYVIEKAVVRKRWISFSERSTPAYESLVKKINQYLTSSILILSDES